MININTLLTQNNDIYLDDENIYKSISEDPIKYFEANETLMDEVVAFAKKKGWKNAIANFFTNNPRLSAQYLLDDRRADFLYALPGFNHGEYALDIGSGMGTVLSKISEFYKIVTAIEPSYKRLLFSKIRLDQEEKKNVIYLNSGFTNTKFRKEIYDLVVLNGVLEWAPLSYPSYVNPLLAQKDFLLRIYKTLKKGAILYIGIENRFYKKAFLGKEDPHTGIKFNSIVPRKIADYLVAHHFKAQNKNRFYRSKKQKEGYRPIRIHTLDIKSYLKM